ncbi:MAG: biotin/lipoyl-binding protein [bacterium]|nr:biotin/lipoyl-binding protein [bacterium]
MRTYDITIGDKLYSIEVKAVGSTSASVLVNGKQLTIGIAAIKEKFTPSQSKAPTVSVTPQMKAPVVASASSSGDNEIAAPIPGKILKLHVKVGDSVKAGTSLLTLEAMKMENEIKTNSDGTVTKLHVAVGDNVSQGQSLVELG